MKVRNPHVVFQRWTCTSTPWNGPKKRLTVGVYIDLDELACLAEDAAKNKSRHSKDGPLHVEFHSAEPIV